MKRGCDTWVSCLHVFSEALDYERIEEDAVQITIRASDSGHLSTTTLLVVHVDDENDNRPEFVRINNITVKEVSVIILMLHHERKQMVFIFLFFVKCKKSKIALVFRLWLKFGSKLILTGH